ncbi:hypothetical protein JCM18899A_17210 [Nocardioides sp. AN3]
MTGSDEGSAGGHDRIGSAAEEAAKLFGALSGWASDLGHGLDAHLATGAPECTYCPICRTVHVLREASPEIKSHLASAAASLLQAAAGVLAAAASSTGQERDRSAGVENIDLDGDQDWPETDGPETDQPDTGQQEESQ